MKNGFVLGRRVRRRVEPSGGGIKTVRSSDGGYDHPLWMGKVRGVGGAVLTHGLHPSSSLLHHARRSNKASGVWNNDKRVRNMGGGLSRFRPTVGPRRLKRGTSRLGPCELQGCPEKGSSWSWQWGWRQGDMMPQCVARWWS